MGNSYNCNGLCSRIPHENYCTSKPGMKRCKRCEKAFDTVASRCPCCQCILRTMSRNRKGRDKVRVYVE